MRVVAVIAITLALAIAGLALHQVGVIQFNRPDPNRFSVTGIDVSHHQGPIDWALVAQAGVQFVFIKATEGRDFIDPRFSTNWTEAKASGIPRGAYHFFTFCTPGAEQAQHFLQVAPPEADALPPVADVEFVGNCKSFGPLAGVQHELLVFIEMVEQAWGRRPILYLTPDALDRVVASTLQGYPVWIRSVFSEPPSGSYRNWAIWQFSDNSRISGIQGPVDRNTLRPGMALGYLSSPAA